MNPDNTNQLDIDLSLVINAHNEGKILGDSLKSALCSLEYAGRNGLIVEGLIILDNADKRTIQVANEYKEEFLVLEVGFGDLGLSRNFGVSKSSGTAVAFLDGDDLISENWLFEGLELLRSSEKKVIVHPEINYFFGPRFTPGSRLLFLHMGSEDSRFSKWCIADQNPWTALCLTDKVVLEDFPYQEINLEMGIGYEDWNFNIQTLASGFAHVVAPGTIHYIRQKAKSSLKNRTSKARADISSLDALGRFMET